jgi:hypothetical protein
MKLSSILGAIGAGGAALKNVTTAAMVFGAVYLVDCRLSARDPGAFDRCYLQAGSLMGLGAVGRGGYSLGYWTENPALRREEDQPGTERDEHGRFVRKKG